MRMRRKCFGRAAKVLLAAEAATRRELSVSSEIFLCDCSDGPQPAPTQISDMEIPNRNRYPDVSMPDRPPQSL